MKTMFEPERQVPVAAEVDVCVIGGSCTGVFAAVRAARLGATVVIVEKTNCFGGVATNGLVHYWHSTQDTLYEKEIIAGLSTEVTDRLVKRQACDIIPRNPNKQYAFNSEELKIELDYLVMQHKSIIPMLHTFYAGASVDNGEVQAVFIENKSGRQAIIAKVYVDASGDGDLAQHCGVPFNIDQAHLQPPTTCAKISGMDGIDIQKIYREHRDEYALAEDSGWSGQIPGSEARMFAETHIFGCDASDAGQLTAAEMEGRRHIRAIIDMAVKYGGLQKKPALLSLASYIGIRETRRFVTDHVVNEQELLHGQRFADAIANGTYRVDIHNPEGGGFLFKYLDGSTIDVGPGRHVQGRWREETAENPVFYQVPYRALTSKKVKNLLLAGRIIGTDRGAFGALRVMINLNQTGEAAGVAACMAARSGMAVSLLDTDELRKQLADGGSIVI